MAVTATVAAVAGTVYVADKMGDAADAQKQAAQTAQDQAATQAQAIQDQTAQLRAQLEEQKKQMELMAQNNQSLLTQQQTQFETSLQAERDRASQASVAQQQQFETLLTQQQNQFAQQSAATQAAYEQQMAQQREQAAAQAQLAEEAKNRANQKKPVTEGFIASNERQGTAGIGGTMLTGSGGVQSTTLPLGKNTLLGA